jgi:hypothetical protein
MCITDAEQATATNHAIICHLCGGEVRAWTIGRMNFLRPVGHVRFMRMLGKFYKPKLERAISFGICSNLA